MHCNEGLQAGRVDPIYPDIFEAAERVLRYGLPIKPPIYFQKSANANTHPHVVIHNQCLARWTKIWATALQNPIRLCIEIQSVLTYALLGCTMLPNVRCGGKFMQASIQNRSANILGSNKVYLNKIPPWPMVLCLRSEIPMKTSLIWLSKGPIENESRYPRFYPIFFFWFLDSPQLLDHNRWWILPLRVQNHRKDGTTGIRALTLQHCLGMLY